MKAMLGVVLFLLFAGASAGLLQAQETDKKVTEKTDKATEKTDKTAKKADVSEAVQKAAAKLAGDAEVKFKAKGKNFEAKWVSDGKKNEALLDAEGKLIRSEIKLTLKDLPEEVRTAVVKKYGEDTVLEFTMITITKGDKVFFEVESDAKGDSMFNAKGEAVDDDEADEDEDEEDDDDGEEEDDDDEEEDGDDEEEDGDDD